MTPSPQTASPAARHVVTKLEYARLKDRSPAAVSDWIKRGRLTAPALVGEGRSARIDVAIADAQLGSSLSLGHQIGFAQREPGRDIFTPTAAAPVATVPTEPNDQSRLLRARAEEAEIRSARAFADEQERNGTWLIRADAEREYGKRLAETVQAVERWLPTLSEQLATLETRDERTLAVWLRARFRELRQKLAHDARQAAAIEPEFATAPCAQPSNPSPTPPEPPTSSPPLS